MKDKALKLFYRLLMAVWLLWGISCNSPSPADRQLAENYYRKGLDAKFDLDYRTALAYLDSAVAKNPKHFMAWLHKGLIYAQLGDFKNSDACYRQALKIRPEFLDARYNLGNNALRQQNYKDAIEIYQKLLEFKEAPEFWHNLGRAYMETGNLSEAGRCFNRAIALDSTYAYGYHSLGTLAERAGDYAKAVAAYQKATRFAPQSDEYWFKYGLVLLRTGDQAAAEHAFRKTIEINPNHTGAVFNLAKLLNAKHAPDAAQWLQRANTLRQQDRRMSRLRRAILQHPENASIHFSLGSELVARKQWIEAIKQFKMALALDPGDTRARINLANAYMMLNNPRQAIAEYQRVLEANPQSREALANLGIVYARQGQADSARQYWRRLLKIDPGNPVARKGLRQLK